jgi:hypothetical protein
MFVNDLCIAIAVTSNFAMIRFHDKLPLEIVAVDILMSSLASGFLLVTYIKFGEANELSKGLLNSWKRSSSTISIPSEKELMKKYIKSCSLLKLELGSFCHYKRPTSIRIAGKLVIYTVKFTMMMKKAKFLDMIEYID